MAYIRKKTYTRKQKKWQKEPPAPSTYYYVVQSYRVEGKVRQSTIAYLGRHSTVQDAIRFTVGYRLKAVQLLTRAKADAAKVEGIPLTYETYVRDVIAKIEHIYSVHATEEYIGARWEEFQKGVAKNQATYKRLHGRVDKLTRKIQKFTEQLATLRHAAAALGITDPEALALPGSQTYAAIEKRTSPHTQHVNAELAAAEQRIAKLL